MTPRFPRPSHGSIPSAIGRTASSSCASRSRPWTRLCWCCRAGYSGVRRSLLHEDAVDQMQGAVGSRRKIGIVGDDDQAGTDAAIELEHQIEDLTCRTAIEI